MWIVSYYRPNLDKWIKAYFVSEKEAKKLHRRWSFDRGKQTKLEYDSSFELQDWDKQHG